MKISILVDDKNSWFVPYAFKLKEHLQQMQHDISFAFCSGELEGGDICFLLSCTKLIKVGILQKYKHNIVIHASDLPTGKGFTPLKWQVLEGKNEITLTLFEAAETVDAGDYYFKDSISFQGHELLGEMQEVMGKKICEMAQKYVVLSEELPKIKQHGEETFYLRRTEKDDQLDVNRTIAEQFEHFRIADNDRFPLWFQYRGHKYFLKIYKG